MRGAYVCVFVRRRRLNELKSSKMHEQGGREWRKEWKMEGDDAYYTTRLRHGVVVTLRRVIKRITKSDTTVRVLPPAVVPWRVVLITAEVESHASCRYAPSTPTHAYPFCNSEPLKVNENSRSTLTSAYSSSEL